MEVEFDQALRNHDQLNNMLHAYETNLIDRYVQEHKSVSQAEDDFDDELNPQTYMVFEKLVQKQPDTQSAVYEWADLPAKMNNPFSVMRRWLKYEILDLEAILEAIQKKNEMEKRKMQKQKQRNENQDCSA